MKYVGCVLIGAMAILCSCRDELRPDLSPAQEGKTNIIVNLTVEPIPEESGDESDLVAVLLQEKSVPVAEGVE